MMARFSLEWYLGKWGRLTFAINIGLMVFGVCVYYLMAFPEAKREDLHLVSSSNISNIGQEEARLSIRENKIDGEVVIFLDQVKIDNQKNNAALELAIDASGGPNIVPSQEMKGGRIFPSSARISLTKGDAVEVYLMEEPAQEPVPGSEAITPNLLYAEKLANENLQFKIKAGEEEDPNYHNSDINYDPLEQEINIGIDLTGEIFPESLFEMERNYLPELLPGEEAEVPSEFPIDQDIEI